MGERRRGYLRSRRYFLRTLALGEKNCISGKLFLRYMTNKNGGKGPSNPAMQVVRRPRPVVSDMVHVCDSDGV